MNANAKGGGRSPLADLIKNRLQVLELSENEFLSRIGYKNFHKGRERLRALEQVEGLRGIEHHDKQIARALNVDLEIVQQAIKNTWAVFWQQSDDAYAASFFPHALIKTERTVPSQITFYAMTGGDRRWRLRKFAPDSSPVTYAGQIRLDLPDRVPFLGKVLGFYVNYSPYQCVEFDRLGEPVSRFYVATRMGVSSIGGSDQGMF